MNPQERNRQVSDRILALGQEIVNQELEREDFDEADTTIFLAGNILVTVAASLLHPERAEIVKTIASLCYSISSQIYSSSQSGSN